MCFLTVLMLDWCLIVVLISISPMTNDFKHFYHPLIGHWYTFLCEISVFAHWKNCVVCIFVIELQEFFICCGYKPFIRYMCCEYLLSICSLPTCFLDSAFWWIEVLHFDEIPNQSFLLWFIFSGASLRNLCFLSGHKDIPLALRVALLF